MSYSFRDHAPALHATGFNPLPILPRTKRPALLGWQRFCSEEMPSSLVAKLAKSSIAYGVGLALGYRGVIGIDVDTDDSEQIRAVISVLPPIRAAKRGRRGFTVFFQDPTGIVQTARLRLVEILARGTQTVMPPSVHPDTGQPYLWLDPEALGAFQLAGALRAPRFDQLPVFGPAQAECLRDTVDAIVGRSHYDVISRRSAIVPASGLGEHERQRQRRYAEAILIRESAALGAMARNSGRNRAAFDLVCRVGRWVHAGIISADILSTYVREACWENGLTSEDGISAVLATIASGLRRSANDALPDLHGGGHVDG